MDEVTTMPGSDRQTSIDAAVAHARRVAGTDQALLLQTLHNLALGFERLGRADDARSLWNEARSIAEMHKGDPHEEPLFPPIHRPNV